MSTATSAIDSGILVGASPFPKTTNQLSSSQEAPMIPRCLFLLVALVLAAATSLAAVPSSIDVICDVRASGAGHFRTLAVGQDEVIFRLWTAETGGSQLGSYPVPMDKLLVTRLRTQSYDGVRGIAFYRIQAVIGDSTNPVVVGSGDAWLEVVVGTETFTCAHSEDKNGQSVPPGPPARKKLAAAPFALQAPDISVRVCRVSVLTVPDSSNTPVPFDMDRWDTATPEIHTLGDPTKLVAPTSGKYLIFGHIAWAGTASGRRQVAIYKNSDPVAIQNESGSTTHFSISTHHELLKDDFVELLVFQDSGSPTDISAGCHPTQNFAADFGMVKLP